MWKPAVPFAENLHADDLDQIGRSLEIVKENYLRSEESPSVVGFEVNEIKRKYMSSSTPSQPNKMLKANTIEKPKPKRGRPKKNYVLPNFKFTTYIKEDHNQPIFGASFSHHLKQGEPIIFATCSANRVSFYECQTNGIKLLQCYSDPDINEKFNTCCWSYDPDTSQPILGVGGLRGIIRIINPMTKTSPKHYIGHCHAINELKFHPNEPSLLLSASKDLSLRLWNVKTDVCVAIFGGINGHRDDILSADFDTMGNRIISSGIDHSLKLWSLDKSSIKEAIRLSFSFNSNKSVRPFGTVLENFPHFSTRDVHRTYVDCVKWLGNFVLSKSCENSIVCWTHKCFEDSLITDGSISVINQIKYTGGNKIFYIRFSMDVGKTYLAVGNMYGTTFIWKLDGDEPTKRVSLRHSECTTVVRQTAFSRDGKILICVCDDGTVWRWDRVD